MKQSFKVLFLDVDGVLNTRPGSLDEDKLRLVGEIVRATGAIVVLSTSWRTVPRMRKRLVQALFHVGVRVHSDTPELTRTMVPWGFAEASPRWAEIAQWFEIHDDIQVTGFCILDDDPQAGVAIEHRFAKIDPEKGLSEREAALAIKMLQSPLP